MKHNLHNKVDDWIYKTRKQNRVKDIIPLIILGRGDKKVYIYNRNGVQAVIPMKYFVLQKSINDYEKILFSFIISAFSI